MELECENPGPEEPCWGCRPCLVFILHEKDKELASLRAEVQKTMSGWQSDSVRLQSRIRQLEEAVEWACARFLETPRSLGFNFDVKELRRKAGM